jgi:hypothetical protein
MRIICICSLSDIRLWFLKITSPNSSPQITEPVITDSDLCRIEDLVVSLVGPDFHILARDGQTYVFVSTDFGSDDFPRNVDDWVSGN